MNLYRADLHIHTCLSPCGSLDMSPTVIVETALARGLDIIAITDHNTTLQCPEIQSLGAEAGLTVLAGAEVCTREEAHCIALFGSDEARAAFQQYLEKHLPPVPNDPGRFGDQVWVNRKDEIMGEAPYLLLSALDQNVNQVAAFVKEQSIDLTVIGMDDPLVGGIVDVFEQEGLRVFGPKKNAAILEGSKAFSKDLMKKYGIPTAGYETFDSPEAAMQYLETSKYPIVLKADGLALGKGVLICNTKEEAMAGVKTLMLDKQFGAAGNTIVVE